MSVIPEEGECFWCERIGNLNDADSVDIEDSPIYLCDRCMEADRQAYELISSPAITSDAALEAILRYTRDNS